VAGAEHNSPRLLDRSILQRSHRLGGAQRSLRLLGALGQMRLQ
jgi:hypothetical protein